MKHFKENIRLVFLQVVLTALWGKNWGNKSESGGLVRRRLLKKSVSDDGNNYNSICWVLTRSWAFFMCYILFTITFWDILLLSSLFCRYSYWGLEKFDNFLKDEELINGWWLGLSKCQEKMIALRYILEIGSSGFGDIGEC